MFFSSPNSRAKSLIRWAKNFKIDLPNKPEELNQVQKLDFKLKGVDKLPKEIDTLPNITEIHGEFNKLTELPWEFANLKKLKVVNLGHNKFADVPGVICKLTQIESLSLEGNIIKKVTPVIANLTNLTNLNLSFNNIAELPVELSHLKHLTSLNIAANKLSTLPDNFQKLYNLTEIKLWKNEFSDTPSVLKELPNLKNIETEVDHTNINHQLIESVISDDLQKVEKLIHLGADINFKWHNYGSLSFTTPLFEAHTVEMIQFLLDKGADISVKRDVAKQGSIKVWESEKKSDFETFFTIKHNPEVTKFIKTLPNFPNK